MNSSEIKVDKEHQDHEMKLNCCFYIICSTMHLSWFSHFLFLVGTLFFQFKSLCIFYLARMAHSGCTNTLSAQILHKYSVCTNTAQMLCFHWTNLSPICTWFPYSAHTWVGVCELFCECVHFLFLYYSIQCTVCT